MRFIPFLAALLSLTPLADLEVKEDLLAPMLFMLHRGNPEKAFEYYLNYFEEKGEHHDFALLQQAAKMLLEQGAASEDPEVRLMSLFGAGVASSADLLPILKKSVHSEDPRFQLIALSYLGQLQDDEADRLLIEALSSPFLITRLEALLLLAQKNHPAVLGHLYALSVKIPPLARGCLAQIAVHLEGIEATRFLHKLLNDEMLEVRAETLLTLAEAGRDDFLPHIRTLASSAASTQQEAAAAALGKLKDTHSIEKLKAFISNKRESVRLAAARSLFQLGETSYLSLIEEAAKKGSLFAIAALGELEEGKETLLQLLSHEERDIRLNASLALLKMREMRTLSVLSEFLIEEGRDLGFWPLSSGGGSLKAWKTLSASSQQESLFPGLKETTLSLREKSLIHCIEFEEKEFLQLARTLFERKQHMLVPMVVELLENKKSAAVIAFLKEGAQMTGAPLIRNYCTLALYRLKEEGPFESLLIDWVKARSREQLIHFREEEGAAATFHTPHLLTPEETSRFLVEAVQTLASAQNQAGIDLLLHAMAYGNPKNRYALAGLLLRSTE